MVASFRVCLFLLACALSLGACQIYAPGPAGETPSGTSPAEAAQAGPSPQTTATAESEQTDAGPPRSERMPAWERKLARLARRYGQRLAASQDPQALAAMARGEANSGVGSNAYTRPLGPT